MEARPELFGQIPGHVLHTLQDGMSIENVFPDIPGTPIHGLYNLESWVFISGQCFAYIGMVLPLRNHRYLLPDNVCIPWR